MSWRATLVTVPPGAEPLTLAQAKAQCLVDPASTADDALLNGLIAAARQFAEDYCGIKLVTQTVEMRCSAWDDLKFLPAAPLQSVTAIAYTDFLGAPQTLDPSIYAVMLYGLYPSIRLAYQKQWPALLDAADAIQITAVAGYPGDPPAPVLQAMLLLIGQWFDVRTGVQVDARGMPAEIPNTVTALLSGHRRL